MAHAEPIGHAGRIPESLPGTVGHTHEHPSEATYIKIALVLCAITVIEVVIYYIQWMHDKGLLVPALLLLSAVKFTFVVGSFMHLKFDDRRLTYIFGGGLFIAFSIVLALYVLFQVHGIDYARNLLF